MMEFIRVYLGIGYALLALIFMLVMGFYLLSLTAKFVKWLRERIDNE